MAMRRGRWGRGFGLGMGLGGGFGAGRGMGAWPGPSPLGYSPWRGPSWPYGAPPSPYAGYGAPPFNPWYPPTPTMPFLMQRQPYYPQQLPPQYSPQEFPYGYARPFQPVAYPQPSARSVAIHMNCAHFNNGVCALRGAPVPPNGPACPSFTPRT